MPPGITPPGGILHPIPTPEYLLSAEHCRMCAAGVGRLRWSVIALGDHAPCVHLIVEGLGHGIEGVHRERVR